MVILVSASEASSRGSSAHHGVGPGAQQRLPTRTENPPTLPHSEENDYKNNVKTWLKKPHTWDHFRKTRLAVQSSGGF